jgi:hypothetical protein
LHFTESAAHLLVVRLRPISTRNALAMGFLLASAAMCSESQKDEDGDAGAGGEGLDSSGGRATGGSSARGGSGGSVAPPGGEGGENSEGGDGPGLGGTAGESGQSNGGSAGSGGSEGGAGSGSGGTSGSASGGIGGSAGSTAGAMSGGTGGANGGRGGASGSGGASGAGMGGTGGGGAGGSVLFFDDFETGTDGWTPTPSGAWSTLTDGSTVYAATGAPANTSARSATAGDLSWTNVAVDARVKITSFVGFSSSYFAGLCVRYQSASSYACMALRSDGSVAFRVNGSNTASYMPGGGITTGVWYTLRVVAIGNNITGYVNGAEVPASTRVTSGAPASGMIALSVPATNAVFDDVRVTVP